MDPQYFNDIPSPPREADAQNYQYANYHGEQANSGYHDRYEIARIKVQIPGCLS